MAEVTKALPPTESLNDSSTAATIDGNNDSAAPQSANPAGEANGANVEEGGDSQAEAQVDVPQSAASSSATAATATPASQVPDTNVQPSPRLAASDETSSTSSSRSSPNVDHAQVDKDLGSAELDVGAGGELELSVPSHQEHLTADGQRYTTYKVVVQMGGRQWSVRKRYSQFYQFRMSLRRQHKEVDSFRFPNKSTFHTFSEHTKERRRTGFDEFLRLVAGLHPRPQEVDVFLAMDEHGAGVQGRAGGQQLPWTRNNSTASETPTGSVPGQAWVGEGRPAIGRRPPPGAGAGRIPRGSTSHRVARFPPLADQGRSEKAAEAAAAVAAAAATGSRGGLSGVVRQVDLMLRRLLGPDLLSMLCVVAVSAVSIVGVWKVGGQPGLATLVIGVCVGFFIQNWDRGVDVWNWGLDMVGLGSSEAPPSASGTRLDTSSSDAQARG